MGSTLEIAGRIAGDGAPLGNVLTLPIAPTQVQTDASGVRAPAFDDNAALTILWQDFMTAMEWVDQNSWLLEWQYIDYLYQSPTYDRDWRTDSRRAARVSRFNVAKNTNTMRNQVRRAIFADDNFFQLKAEGREASDPDQQLLLDAATVLFKVLNQRADFEYQFGRLFLFSQCLQGTAIGIPLWEERTVRRQTRHPKAPPLTIEMPFGTRKVHTRESDDWETRTQTVKESWPSFQYRRLGTTMWSTKWRTPGRPDLTGGHRIDVDYVSFEDLNAMKELACYKGIPDTEDLKTFFLANPLGDAPAGTQVAQNMNANSSIVMHAAGENVNASADPFSGKMLMKIARWTEKRVIEVLCWENGRRKVIRNEEHNLGSHALGYSANWYDIENSGYGYGIGRLNAGDQRMSQGVLNESLKMIGFPMNAPLLYDRDSGNPPTQNVLAGLGKFLAVGTGKSGDVNKALAFMRMPEIPPEAWRVLEMAVSDAEHIVGADAATMQGQLPGPGSSIGRTATGASRLATKADENISDPVSQAEQVISRWFDFLWKMVQEEMPIREIREILGDHFADAILEKIDTADLLNAKFSIKVLAGQKLAARAAIAQLIPFLLQLVQQPQLMQFMHEKGWTINYQAIERLFLRVTELAGEEDIIIPLTPQEQQMVSAMQPGMQQIRQKALVEQLKGRNKLQEIQAQGTQDLQNTLIEKAADRAESEQPFEDALMRVQRQSDMDTLRNGVVQ